MPPVPTQSDWRPSGVVTLTSDFGHVDPYVGIMKGVMLSVASADSVDRRLELVDLTHGVRPQAVEAAGFYLEHSWRRFPAGTVHLAIVDPGVGTERRLLVCAVEGHLFVAPDNGLLGPILAAAAEAGEEFVCRRVDVERHRGSELSRTFHGRDLFAPLAARLACGLDPADVGPEIEDWVPMERQRPAPGPDGELACRVLLADGFGNLVTSARAEDLPGLPEQWYCELGAVRIPLVGTYGDGASGELLALVDSFGYWEVAVRDGDAARRLAAGPGTPVVFRCQGLA